MAAETSVNKPLLGAHVSIAGGIAESPARGARIGCDSIQIFTKSTRQWASKPYTKEEVEAFKRNRKDYGITIVIAHDSYLLNLGAPDAMLRKKSIVNFIDELERCEMLGVPYLVAHPGSHVGSGEAAGLKTIAASIDEAHASCGGFRTRIALEITAGQGSNLGCTFEQMGHIFDAVKENERLALCFDTEHAFASGYDIRTAEGYERTLGELDEKIGLDRIVAFHLNDSLKPFNSHVDRHEHIGKGYIGIEPFERLINDPRFAGIAMCLETEPGEEMKDIAADLKTLRGLLKAL
jgi:deoxyribonuclease-4